MLAAMALVGRERELALLAEAVHRVAEGRLGRVVLTGSAGIGCTRLLDELVARVSVVPGVTVCRGRAFEPAMGAPYQAVGDALGGALARLDDARLTHVLERAAHDLSLLVPDLSKRLVSLGIDRSPPTLIAPDQVGRRVIESILGALGRLAGGGVTLLIIEDLHIADPATRGLVEALETVGRGVPVCLVVTYQPDELHRRHPARELADRLRDDLEAVHLFLEPLSNRDIERIVADAAPDRPRGSVMTAVIEGARGNPFTALWLAESAETLEGVRLSDSFDQLCGARLEVLSREEARAVRVMAAARLPMPRTEILALQLPEGRITIPALEGALASGFLVAVGDRVAIAHDLLAEAVTALELTPERQAIHAALAGRSTSWPALAAWHWSRAGRPSEARDAHIRAATSAQQVDPGETVLGHYEEALELPGTDRITPEERAALLAGAAAASASAGRFRRAVALQRRAVESRATREASSQRGARDAATRLALGEMYAELGRYQWAGGELDGALDSMERALGIMPPEPSRIRARAQASLAQHLMITGRFEESARIARLARDTAVDAAELGEATLAEQGHAICTLGMDEAYLGDLAAGLASLEEASAIARRAGRLDDLMRVAANHTTLLDLDSRREEALTVVQASLADAEAGGLGASYGAFLRGNAADILYHLGRWQEAEEACRIAMQWRMSALEAEWWPPLLLGLLLAESRADDEAARLVGKAMLQLETVPAGQWTGHMIRAAISVALWSSDAEGALSIAERAWPRALETDELAVIAWSAAICLEAAAAAAELGRERSETGLIVRARSLAELILPEAEAHIARSSIGPHVGARQEADLNLATARAHARRIRGRGDPRVWGELARAWAERGMPYREAKARWWQALAILAGADEDEREAARVDARAPLAEAARIAQLLPALPLLGAVVDLAARARVTLPSAALVATAGPGVEEDGLGHAREALVAVGPGTASPWVPVAVGPGRFAPAAADPAQDVARAIEERVIAALRRGPHDAYGLSPREQEVLNILSEGRTDRDIAARLFISERTVHVHVRRILAKLRVSSRTEAAGLAIRQGLVPELDPATLGRRAARSHESG
jgi:DNA-binding CsgD family transcriptional regulator/tetratricopeptide (TPR) repeat protein